MMTGINRIVSVTVSAALVCVPLVAGAADGASSEAENSEAAVEESASGEADGQTKSDKKRSVKLFKEGYDAYSNQNWTAALSLFREAHAYHPDARFLLNAAKAAMRAGNLDQGLGLAEKALNEDREAFRLGPDQREAADELKGQLEKRIEERGRQRALAAERGLQGKGWSGVGAVAVGAGLVGLGVGLFGQNAQNARVEAQGAGTFGAYQDDLETFNRAQRNGRIALYTGIGVAAVGGSLIVWELVENKTARSKLSFGSPGAKVGATFQVSF